MNYVPENFDASVLKPISVFHPRNGGGTYKSIRFIKGRQGGSYVVVNRNEEQKNITSDTLFIFQYCLMDYLHKLKLPVPEVGYFTPDQLQAFGDGSFRYLMNQEEPLPNNPLSLIQMSLVLNKFNDSGFSLLDVKPENFCNGPYLLDVGLEHCYKIREDYKKLYKTASYMIMILWFSNYGRIGGHPFNHFNDFMTRGLVHLYSFFKHLLVQNGITLEDVVICYASFTGKTRDEVYGQHLLEAIALPGLDDICRQDNIELLVEVSKKVEETLVPILPVLDRRMAGGSKRERSRRKIKKPLSKRRVGGSASLHPREPPFVDRLVGEILQKNNMFIHPNVFFKEYTSNFDSIHLTIINYFIRIYR